MTLLQKVEEKYRTQREEDLRWRNEVEQGIEKRHNEIIHNDQSRHRATLIIQFLLALLAAAVALIAAKMLPWFS